jgi:alanine racemase
MIEHNPHLAGYEQHVPLSEALISVSHLVHNLYEIRRTVGASRRIMAIVKANAYAHTVEAIAPALLEKDVHDFGVANINEAIHLRKVIAAHGKTHSAILAFASPLLDQVELYAKHDIELCLGNAETIQQAEAMASRVGKKLTVHLKIDTGMGRLGAHPSDALALAEKIEASPHLDLKAIFTHFASSGTDKAFTKKQLGTYKKLVSEFEHHHSRSVVKHAANSGAVVSEKDSFLDMVRPGILLYGYLPGAKMKSALDLKPVMQLQSRVIFTKWVERGTSISYSRKWTAARRCRIATVSIGYADGLHRALTNTLRVCINGKFYPQVGAVTMDQIMINLGNDTTVNTGDTVVIFGWNGMRADVLAEKVGTIGYEFLCAVSPRVRRMYVK